MIRYAPPFAVLGTRETDLGDFSQIEKLYEDDSDDDSWGGRTDDDGDEDGPRQLGPPREDLERIMDDFLSRYEVLGGKMRHVLEPTTGVEGNAGKLDRIRKELASLDLGEAEEGEDPEKASKRLEKARILAAVERQWKEEVGRKDKIRMDWEKPKERWDCETVLSTLLRPRRILPEADLPFRRRYLQ